MSMNFNLVDDNSKEAIDIKSDAVARALEIIGGKAMGYASGLAPVKTGRLAGSINYATARGSGKGGADPDSTPMGKPEEGTVYIGTNVEYAIWQEYGTSQRPAANGGNGYIQPAIENHLDEFRDILQSELESAPSP